MVLQSPAKCATGVRCWLKKNNRLPIQELTTNQVVGSSNLSGRASFSNTYISLLTQKPSGCSRFVSRFLLLMRYHLNRPYCRYVHYVWSGDRIRVFGQMFGREVCVLAHHLG